MALSNDGKIRPVRIIKDYVGHADGSCLFSMGNTQVLCVASVENKRPSHAEERNIGWVTAEYAMLPRAGNKRTPRGRAQSGGRAQEISRLIGRSLRAATHLERIGDRSIVIDCDVILADGGTRTASINGGMIALALALKKLYKEKMILKWPLKDFVGAISVGIVKDRMVLDLDYEDDQKADSDMNFVMTGRGKVIEIQGTAEGAPFSHAEFSKCFKMAQYGIREILKTQRKAIGRVP